MYLSKVKKKKKKKVPIGSNDSWSGYGASDVWFFNFEDGVVCDDSMIFALDGRARITPKNH